MCNWGMAGAMKMEKTIPAKADFFFQTAQAFSLSLTKRNIKDTNE